MTNKIVGRDAEYYADREKRIILAVEEGYSFRVLGVVWGITAQTVRRLYPAHIRSVSDQADK